MIWFLGFIMLVLWSYVWFSSRVDLVLTGKSALIFCHSAGQKLEKTATSSAGHFCNLGIGAQRLERKDYPIPGSGVVNVPKSIPQNVFLGLALCNPGSAKIRSLVIYPESQIFGIGSLQSWERKDWKLTNIKDSIRSHS